MPARYVCTLLETVILIIPEVIAFTHIPFTRSSIVRTAFCNKHPFGMFFHGRKVSRAGNLMAMALEANVNEESGSGKQSTMETLERSTSPYLDHRVLINVVTEKTEMSVAKKLSQVINWAYRGKPGVPGWTGRSSSMILRRSFSFSVEIMYS